MKTRIGLIGLGNAGLALGTAIVRRFPVSGFDLNETRRALAQHVGIDVRHDARAVAAGSDILMLCLPEPSISRAVLTGIGPEALKGRLIVENSTVGPEDIEALLAITQPAGARVMEAAILGGVAKLTAGKGTFLVGASDTDLAHARPVLEAAAEKLFHLGPLGNGMRAKLVCNGVSHAVMVVFIEAAALAAKQGIPMETFCELMLRDSGLMRPLAHRFIERIRHGDFEGGMTVANAHKDSALILDVARELGVPLFAMSASHTPYEIALGEERQEGRSPQDYASIAKLWEKWAGVRFTD